MKLVLGVVITATGICAIVVCCVALVQFNTAVQSAASDLAKYPVLKLFAPDTMTASTVSDAEQIAENMRFRMYATGVVGFFMALAGIIVAVSGKHARREDG